SKGSKVTKAGQTLDKISDAAQTTDKIADTGKAVDKINDAAKVTEQIGDFGGLSQIEKVVQFGKLTHTLKVKRIGDKIRLVICSECGSILEKIDQVLPNISPKGSTKSLHARLTKLKQHSIALEDKINVGKVPFKQIPAEVNQIAAHLKDLSKKYPEFDFSPSFVAKLDYDSLAKRLGFTKTNYKSHGQPVYRRGNEYITPDIDSHIGGVWKKADSVRNLGSRQTRMGTYDEHLNRIGD
ncbi:MAG: hypothetical protein F6K47_35640, partial [Symploca sp. SIO2E6]|nr:hypothetical protein [Symploca sp. SIO2E6]